MEHFETLVLLLRDRATFLEEVRQGKRLEAKILSLLVVSSLFFAVYGAIIGSSSGGLQMMVSMIKLPALYLLTLLICLPTLYFFDILFGSNAGFKQYTVLSLTTVAVISVLLFSFAPVTLFFLVSIHSYHFFLLLNAAIFTLTGLIGVRLFYSGIRSVMEFTDSTPKIRHQRQELYAAIETNLVMLRTLQVNHRASEYRQFLQEALAIGVAVQQEINSSLGMREERR